MAKVISEKAVEAASEVKIVEIKFMKTMQNASGEEVEVLDYTETKSVDEAIEQAELRKGRLDAEVVEVEAELVELKAIRDA